MMVLIQFFQQYHLQVVAVVVIGMLDLEETVVQEEGVEITHLFQVLVWEILHQLVHLKVIMVEALLLDLDVKLVVVVELQQ